MPATKPVAPAAELPAETQRRTRGHRFYPPKAEQKRIPALYATEGTPLAEKTVHQHYFTGGFDFYVTEWDPQTGRAFGMVKDRGEREWGYFMLPDLEAIKPRGTYVATGGDEGVVATGTLQWVVERDMWWTPVPAGTL